MDLPGLQQGRWNHGCSYFNNAEGTKVGIDINYSSIIIFQTYLVSGGLDHRMTGDPFLLSSTELLVSLAPAWVFTGELPSPRFGLRGANIDNTVFMTGGN